MVFRFLSLAGLTGLVGLTSLLGLPALAQVITDPSPEQGATAVEADTSISAIFRPDSMGVTLDPRSLRVFLNDRDITNDSVITKDFFSYRPERPLTPGNYQVVLQFNNSQGQSRRVGWNFTVGSSGPLAIDDIAHNAGNRPLRPGEVMAVTVNGTPGSQVKLFLIRDGQTVQPLPDAQEIAPGTYVSNIVVQEANSTREGILVARLQRGNQVRFATAQRPIRLVVGARPGQQLTGPTATPAPVANPLQPRLTNLNDGDRISGAAFTLQGLTAPNAQVRIRVDATTPIGGGFLTATQTIVNDVLVTADSQGVFSYVVRPPIPVPNTTYQVNLTGIQGGQTSSTITVRLVQQ
ncbi:MAG: hypothetical protein Q6J68_02050 [Thermostichales cyanobacterium SZTDM-1c_bins_54]